MINDKFFWKFSAVTGWSLTDIPQSIEGETDEEWEGRTGFNQSRCSIHSGELGEVTTCYADHNKWIIVDINNGSEVGNFSFIVETVMDLIAWVEKYKDGLIPWGGTTPCQLCGFWKRNRKGYPTGECRLHPPVIVGNNFRRPETDENDGCGQGRRKTGW